MVRSSLPHLPALLDLPSNHPLRPAYDAIWATVDWRAFLRMLLGP